jgi:hypothetical protein
MTNMKSLEGTELVLRISGEVEQSNLQEFETQALAVIENINTNLETDEDFAEAEVNIKGCQLMENRIATARSSALANTAAIAELIKTTERLEAKFRETRLKLKNLVVHEKDRRKGEVMNAARKRLTDRLESSPVKHGFVIDNTAITNAAKNRRSLKALEESVNEVIDAEIARLSALENLFVCNIGKIEEFEADWPGLFPDKKNIALSAIETVDAMLLARVADHMLKVAEKARMENEEAQRKAVIAEEQRIARAIFEAEKLAMESEHLAEISPVASGAIVEEPRDYVPIPEPFVEFPIPPPVDGPSKYVLTVSITTYDIGLVMDALRENPGVESVAAEF